MSWRENLLYPAFMESELDSKGLGLYQFGVFSGESMHEINLMMAMTERDYGGMYGFDIFTGMPKETAEPIFQESWDPDIDPDAFNAVLKYGFNSARDWADYLENETNSRIFVGLVEDTLPKAAGLLPAFYIDIDLDIYSPTKFVLDYMARSGLIIEGTLIGYDDWGGTPGFETYANGESRAHKEVCDSHGIVMTKLSQCGTEFPHVQNVWRVDVASKLRG